MILDFYPFALIQYLNLELKWNGAPFASMLRRHQSDYSDSNDSVLKVVFVQLTSSAKVKQFRYSSIFLQVKLKGAFLFCSLLFFGVLSSTKTTLAC